MSCNESSVCGEGEANNEFGQRLARAMPDWRGAERPPRSAMDGAYCRLEPLDIDKHAAALFRAFEPDPSGWTYLSYGPFGTEADFVKWLQQFASSGDPLFFVVVDKACEGALGLASYLDIRAEHGVIEVGHLHFAQALRRSRVATEAMFLMMRRVFDELHYRRYEWTCNSLNEPSRRAAERLGFRFEGTLRQCRVYKQRNRDTLMLSVIDSEWPRLKARFLKWLSPDNFDHNANQIVSLHQF